MAALQNHPQRGQIVEAIMSGQPCRDIAKWVMPRVSHQTVNQLARQVRSQIDAARVLDKANKLVEIGEALGVKDLTAEKLTGLAASAAPHLARIQQNADMLREIALEARAGGDLKTAVTAIKTDLGATELSGRFDRSLEAPNSTVINVHQMMVLPNRDQPTELEVIEAEFEEEDPAE